MEKLSRDIERIIESDCGALAVRYYHLIDRDRFREAADMFTPDGTFTRAGKTMVGPEEVLVGLNERAAGAVIRHLVSNLVVDVISADRADVRYDLSVFIQKGAADGGKPGVPPMNYMRDCVDEFGLNPKGWLIKRKHTDPIFRT